MHALNTKLNIRWTDELVARGFSYSLMPEASVDPTPTGPPQRGRGVKGHYVYWITMPQPTAELVLNTGVKQPLWQLRHSLHVYL